MFITLPLALIGVGLMIYLLFAAATYVVPICAGLSIGFAVFHIGASYTSAWLLGFLAFLLVIMLGQMATQLVPTRHARIGVALLFAIPAAVAGFQVASSLLHLGGVAPWNSWDMTLSLAAAVATGMVAATRHQTVPRR